MDELENKSEKPHDEVWWERELNRNEKLMDKYMAAFGEDPDKFKHPRDLYNKVHFNIDPPDSAEDETNTDDSADASTIANAEARLNEIFEEAEKSEAAGDNAGVNEAVDAAYDLLADEDDDDNESPDNENYPALAKLALKFAVQILKTEDIPEETEVLYLSAGKVGANLAGGDGLGYDDDFICGNIVKCRWALADCEFCREMLEHLYERTGQSHFAQMRDNARELSTAIKERIARLRQRVWW